MGHTVKDACNALGVSRSSYYSYKRPNKHKRENTFDSELLEKIKEIKTNHPFWGYRRVTAWLKYRGNIIVNRKKVYCLMKEHDLLVKQKSYKAKRTPKSKPKANSPNEIWGIDMTKFMVNGLGWVYFVVVLDWYTKKIVGYNISLTSKTRDWLDALDKAINNQFSDGVRGEGLKLVSDNGSQPTSRAFMQKTKELGIRQIFTTYNNPKGNADTERVIRTIKEEVIWINEFTSLTEVCNIIPNWIEIDYNKLYIHSRLNYKSPEEFEEGYYRSFYQKVA